VPALGRRQGARGRRPSRAPAPALHARAVESAAKLVARPAAGVYPLRPDALPAREDRGRRRGAAGGARELRGDRGAPGADL
jgi:hypothetical protein